MKSLPSLEAAWSQLLEHMRGTPVGQPAPPPPPPHSAGALATGHAGSSCLLASRLTFSLRLTLSSPSFAQGMSWGLWSSAYVQLCLSDKFHGGRAPVEAYRRHCRL